VKENAEKTGYQIVISHGFGGATGTAPQDCTMGMTPHYCVMAWHGIDGPVHRPPSAGVKAGKSFQRNDCLPCPIGIDPFCFIFAKTIIMMIPFSEHLPEKNTRNLFAGAPRYSKKQLFEANNGSKD
jgi:hypothetical protein